MSRRKNRIAILSPVAWRTPPRHYGAWETVAGNLCEGLVDRGWDVTLFATADSQTAAKLEAVVERGYEEDEGLDAKVCEYLHLSNCFELADRFDLIHSHYDFMALAYSRLVSTPMVTTIHGFSSSRIMPMYWKYREGNFVSISESDRCADLNYLGTVYNGIDCRLYPFQERAGEDLIFLGRIHPDKGLHLAIQVAKKVGKRLLIGGVIQDRDYFEHQISPHLDGTQIIFLGPLGVAEKNQLFAGACGLLHLNTIPERFGLVLAEANCAGVPVIAMDLGSCREVILHNETGFLVRSVSEAADAVARLHLLDRTACRLRVERLFSIQSMVRGYEEIYQTILQDVR